GLSDLCDGDTAVPNPSRLVVQKIQLESQKRIYQVGWRIKQQTNALRMFRLNGKVERLFFFYPVNAEWQWLALSLLPSGSFHRPDCDGVGCFRRTMHVVGHINARTVHCTSLLIRSDPYLAFNATA